MDSKCIYYIEGRRGSTILTERAGVPFVQSRMLAGLSGVVHGVSTRWGGVSTGEYASMNFRRGYQDPEENILENYRRMGEALGIPPKRMVAAVQTHTTNVREVTMKDGGEGVLFPAKYQHVDGLITRERGLCLVTFYADCVPLFFVDPVHSAIGLSHAGWRGTRDHMGVHTLETMREAYGTRPEEVYVFIGPSICQNCYEVGREVADVFPHDCIRPGREDHFYLDLHRAHMEQLITSGVLEAHLSCTDLCTRCNPEMFFSHRKNGNRRGTIAAFLCLQ